MVMRPSKAVSITTDYPSSLRLGVPHITCHGSLSHHATTPLSLPPLTFEHPRTDSKYEATVALLHDIGGMTVVSPITMAEASPLADKLPAELRIRIYGEVLQASYPLLIARPEYSNETK